LVNFYKVFTHLNKKFYITIHATKYFQKYFLFLIRDLEIPNTIMFHNLLKVNIPSILNNDTFIKNGLSSTYYSYFNCACYTMIQILNFLVVNIFHTHSPLPRYVRNIYPICRIGLLKCRLN